jgi:hypothetical protein
VLWNTETRSAPPCEDTGKFEQQICPPVACDTCDAGSGKGQCTERFTWDDRRNQLGNLVAGTPISGPRKPCGGGRIDCDPPDLGYDYKQACEQLAVGVRVNEMSKWASDAESFRIQSVGVVRGANPADERQGYCDIYLSSVPRFNAYCTPHGTCDNRDKPIYKTCAVRNEDSATCPSMTGSNLSDNRLSRRELRAIHAVPGQIDAFGFPAGTNVVDEPVSFYGECSTCEDLPVDSSDAASKKYRCYRSSPTNSELVKLLVELKGELLSGDQVVKTSFLYEDYEKVPACSVSQEASVRMPPRNDASQDEICGDPKYIRGLLHMCERLQFDYVSATTVSAIMPFCLSIGPQLRNRRNECYRAEYSDIYLSTSVGL